MSKQRWFDCRGRELHAGDMVRGIGTDKKEMVYECHPKGNPDELNLGLNASNERFLELHPEVHREIYPFDEFSYHVNDGQRWLTSYEKVV